jgi:hypothetical protein
MGDSIDLGLMSDLAQRGGGSSRFISDPEEIKKIFGTELGRTAIPAAYDLKMRLEFLQSVKILVTWGYDNIIEEKSVTYYLPTLHHNDYETILVSFRTYGGENPGLSALARFSLSYRDLQDTVHQMGPFDILCEYVDLKSPVSGFSNGMVLRSGTTLHFAETLKRIGKIYYSGSDTIDKNNKYKIRNCLDLSVEMRKELKNVKLRLDDVGFDDEIGILDNYIQILGQDLDLQNWERTMISADDEITPRVRNRPLDSHLKNLFREIVLDMQGKDKGSIAVAGFTMKREKQPELITLLNEMSLVELTGLDKIKVIERSRLDRAINEQKLNLSDLIDTKKAISVGNGLSARYILTGTCIEMPNTVVIFGRVVNVETTEIESAAQVIVPKTKEVMDLL